MRFLLLCLMSLTVFGLQAQKLSVKVHAVEDAEWVSLMLQENPNVDRVDSLYLDYFRKNTFVKSFYTQYYKRWRRAVNPFLGEDGFVDYTRKRELAKLISKRRANYQSENRAAGWSLLGPYRNVRSDGGLSGAQVNVYSLGACAAAPDILYAGTENGEIYKSINGGDSWSNVSMNVVPAVASGTVIANAGFKAIAVHPTNPDIAYAGAGNELYKTVDGGQNWEVVLLAAANLFGYIETPSEVLIHPTNPDIVIMTGMDGLHRSTDAGLTWEKELDFHCYDVKCRPGSADIMYTVRNTPSKVHEFLRSEDAGETWIAQSDGWYNSTNASRAVQGARLAVSEADPMRVYAHLIGDSKAGDSGFIGIYRSDDGGDSWFNTMGYDGAPYDDNHINLAAADIWNYNQGFYNCAIMASNSNADELLVGGIGMWRSTDGGASFDCVFNYGCGDYDPMHVDMQDFRAIGDTYWATTDGGIYKSNDLFASQPEFKMDGLYGVDYWGFGSGWNYDVLVGGTFHNGVDVFYEDYPEGDFLDLGNGEPASGYVNPGDSLLIYFTSNTRHLSNEIDGPVVSGSIGASPNESPWFAESSELLFHPDCYNHIYLGSDNQLMKSTNGGGSFSTLYTAAVNSLVLDIDISRKNPERMFAIVRTPGGQIELVKTLDEWQTSSILDLPANGSEAIISMDPEDDQVLWLAFARGSNGAKVFRSENGGISWTNESSSVLDFQTLQSISTIGGTDGGVYLCTNVTCYYKNNSMTDWMIDSENLPLTISTRGVRPFYRDGKVRIATHGKGIWERTLIDQPAYPLAKIMVDKLSVSCSAELFYFDDYSMLNHQGASWNWSFENANISNSNLRNPVVSFLSYGEHLVTLEITDANGNTDSDSLYISIIEPDYPQDVQEDFELGIPSAEWEVNELWTQVDGVGAYGESEHSIRVNNFSISNVGARFDIIIPIDMENLSPEEYLLSFDVAYARYNAGYSDTLEVLVSIDCGQSWTSHYYKGGTDLATAADFTPDVFVPEAEEWRSEEIDLSEYLGEKNVLIRFSNINGYGQALYLDNINIGEGFTSTKSAGEKTAWTVFPNPVHPNGRFQINGIAEGTVECGIYKASGKLILNTYVQNGQEIDLSVLGLSPGVYTLRLKGNDEMHFQRLLVVGQR